MIALLQISWRMHVLVNFLIDLQYLTKFYVDYFLTNPVCMSLG